MTARTPTYLKSVFESGDIPAGSDYSDVFDSFLPITTTGKQTLNISLEITGDFTADNIYGNNIYASAFSTNILNVSQVSASAGNFNLVNAQIVSASAGLFNTLDVQKVLASVMNTNIINAQRVSASAMNVTDVYKVDGTTVVSNQGSAVVEVSGGLTIDAESRTAINAIINRLRGHGLIAS
jgi:hypothetical protein